MAKQNLTSPSAILKKLMEDYGLNPSKLGAAINLNQGTLRLILLGKGKISCPVAFKFAKFFGKTPEYWLNLQNQYDIAEASRNKELTADLKSIKQATKAPPAKKETKDAAAKKKAAAKKDDLKAKKSGRPAADSKKAAAGKAPATKKSTADSKKTVKAAGKASAVKKSTVKKTAADQKAAEPKPTGAKRGRKPKSKISPAVSEPGPAFAPKYGTGDPASGFAYQEETPAMNQNPKNNADFSLPDVDESWES